MIDEITQKLQTSHNFSVTKGTLTFSITSLTSCHLTNHSRTFFSGTLQDCYNLLLRYSSSLPKSTFIGILLITPGEETFNYSPYLDDRFLAEVIYEGYLPIATKDQEVTYVLAKLHDTRALITLTKSRVSRTIRKRQREFRILVNTDYEGVCEAVRKVHGHGWLYPEICEVYKKLLDSTYLPSLQLITIEVYKEDKLVAGELGYTLGSIYSSLTGFYDRDYPGSGKVQLEGLRCLLIKKGIKYWDLGMEMEYKSEMGALGVPRSEWLDIVRSNRDLVCESLVGYNSGPDLVELLS